MLTGMGGAGKTQLAADYARNAWAGGELDVLVWINASNVSAAASGYGQAGVEVLGVEGTQDGRAAEAFLAWLEPKPGQAVCRWLVVLDDVADPADLQGWWPPASPHGRTVVTTRRRDAALTGPGRQRIEVGLFSETESLNYLRDTLALHGRSEPEAHLRGLAADLGHLPLALSQAAAYLLDTGIACPPYRALLADRTRSFSDAAPDALPDGQTHSAAAAWALSIDRADALRPVGLARPMLRLASFLDPNGIPEAVLITAPSLTHLTGQGVGGLRLELVTAERARLALRSLYRLSLIDHDPGRTVRVHQLIQQAVRDSLSGERYDDIAVAAADVLVAEWPEVESDVALAQILRANTSALTDQAAEALYRCGVHPVLFRAGLSLGEVGQIAAAREHFQRVTDMAVLRLGPDHPDTLTAWHSLARWRGTAGDVAGAVDALEAVSAERVRVLGHDHPHALSARSDLAYWRGRAGDVVGAVAACTELLADRVRVLGPDHPHTLVTRQSLAHWRGKAGDPAGAVQALAELLEDRSRVLGPDHPRTLSTRLNLARWRGEAGEPAAAATALAELLKDYVQVLGADHPHTLVTRLNLARWRGEAGEPAAAATALAELLDDYMRVLGPDHIDSLMTRRALAHWRGHSGDASGAVLDLADLVEDYRRVLGPDAPHTLAVRSNLAEWQGKTGNPAAAATALAELLDDCLRALGPDHPDTRAVQRGLARWKARAGALMREARTAVPPSASPRTTPQVPPGSAT
ncbi:tetratricopeptide repeat protein [Streptomyces sp. NPDC054837]